MVRIPAAGFAAGGQSRDGVIDVWSIRLDRSPEERAVLARVLTAEERARADRFVFERHRDRFIACRGAVRVLLGDYLEVDPSAVTFEYGPFGKPRLASAQAMSGLEFNVSHSEDLALCAVAFGQEIGVDVEQIRVLEGLDDVARQFFSPLERTLLLSAEGDRYEAFFTCWTRKEAFVKALGDGLGYGLDEFSVSLDPLDARVLSVERDPREVALWHMVPVHPADGFAGALAWRGGPLRIVVRRAEP